MFELQETTKKTLCGGTTITIGTTRRASNIRSCCLFSGVSLGGVKTNLSSVFLGGVTTCIGFWRHIVGGSLFRRAFLIIIILRVLFRLRVGSNEFIVDDALVRTQRFQIEFGIKEANLVFGVMETLLKHPDDFFFQGVDVCVSLFKEVLEMSHLHLMANNGSRELIFFLLRFLYQVARIVSYSSLSVAFSVVTSDTRLSAFTSFSSATFRPLFSTSKSFCTFSCRI